MDKKQAQQALNRLIEARMEETKTSYVEAFTAMQQENPDLLRGYLAITHHPGPHDPPNKTVQMAATVEAILSSGIDLAPLRVNSPAAKLPAAIPPKTRLAEKYHVDMKNPEFADIVDNYGNHWHYVK